ncbi:MAG TPA: sugar ABC transporter permease [Candidatus Bathyarchaeia archaeon]|nr:sugar ABC transporter permease [Candidatus Bathyarchaeia archaeon]
MSRSVITDRHFLVTASWPSLIVMLAVTAVPFLVSIGLSLTDYDLVRSDTWKFIGLGNFADLIADPHTPTIIFNTAYLVVGTTVACTLVGMALALLMDTGIRGIGLIRSLYLIPIMTAPIVVALTWRAMFNNDAGWINYFLSLVHLPQPVWLGDAVLAMPTVIISDMWTGVPFMAVLLLAGLLAVPQDLKQAAQVDGASSWQVFRNVTLPSLRPVLFIAIVLKFMDGFRKFEGIQILTTGGPGYASTTLNLHIYNTGLFYDQVGYAASFGVVMVAMIAVSIGVIYLLIGRDR